MATLFCPSCSNLLVISAESGLNKWACNTCPYEFPITKQMTSRTRLARKQADDVLGGEEMWKHADSIADECFDVPSPSLPPMVHDPRLDLFCGPWVRDPSFTSNLLTVYAYAHPICAVTCEKCEHGRAYFYQVQIRSADEPMTTCEPFHFFLRLGASSLIGLFVSSLPVRSSPSYADHVRS
jgi:DNA-directed RNA polymerase III subunit RPC11